jgi:uncharacterized Zn finger protein
MERVLKAKSSSGQPYDVTIEFVGGALAAQCTCKAGVMRRLCKHRIALLQGDASMLYDSTQGGDLNEVMSWVQATAIPPLLARLSDVEKEIERAEKQAKELRKTILEALSTGLSRRRSSEDK